MIGGGVMGPGCRRIAAVLLAALPASSLAAEQHVLADVPYVPTPARVVDAMLGLARVGPQDYVVDLGSGDGRIVIAAASKHGARGFGVEIDGALVSAARREAERLGVADRVSFEEGNLFGTDFGRATVLTMYLFPGVMMQLRPRLFAELAPGTRIVSHEFDMGKWRPDAQLTIPVPHKPHGPASSEVYLWIMPANAAGAWNWRFAEGAGMIEHELVLRQAFQVLDGRAMVGGRPARLESGRMRGNEIRLVLVAETGSGTLRREYRGRMNGDRIRGEVILADGGKLDWNATRVRRGRIQLQ